MLFISKQYLCVHRSTDELDAIAKDELRRLIENMPSNTIYFETYDGKLYGMITHGDIFRAQDGMVPINKSFIFLNRNAYMEARERLRQWSTIKEIPVVENGELIGEFNKYDDELMLEYFRSLEYNAYAAAYFAKFHNVALVKPPAPRTYKIRYFEKLGRILDRYGVAYAIVDFSDIAANLEIYDTFFVVDEQEWRGAKIILDHFEDKPHLLYKIVPFIDVLTKLESAEVMDYQQTFFDLEQKGAKVILITTKHSTSEYVVKLEKKMKERFPIVLNNLYKLMEPYEKEFFDDLYENEDYVRSMKTGYFVVEKDRSTLRLRDTHSDFINVDHGERVTVGQPDDYTRTIYFFGPCLIIGAYVGDAFTIESYLQAMINEAGYKVRVVNCGCWGGNVASISRMLSTLIREGDIVVTLLETPEIGISGLETVDLYSVLEKHQAPAEWLLDTAFHANHHASELYAQELFDVIFDENYRDNPTSTNYITQSLDLVDKFFIQKYFHGEDLGRFEKVACCVFNGNPFTNGHRHLIETASKATDHVYLLSVKEDSSVFSFNERYAMAVNATSDLGNVTVVPSGLFIGNITNFPAYYAKVYEGDVEEQVRMHVEAYASIATLLHATHRFVGEEPQDPVANRINEACKEILPGYGIETVIVERKEDASGIITGSRVRELAAHDDPEVDNLVPKATADIIRCTAINAF